MTMKPDTALEPAAPSSEAGCCGGRALARLFPDASGFTPRVGGGSLGGLASMNSEDRDKQRRRELMLRGVADQLSSGDTPEVRVHYERLLSLGYSDAEARELIATVLAFYIWHIARHDDYTYSDYVAELEKLPEIDWKDDDKDDA